MKIKFRCLYPSVKNGASNCVANCRDDELGIKHFSEKTEHLFDHLKLNFVLRYLKMETMEDTSKKISIYTNAVINN